MKRFLSIFSAVAFVGMFTLNAFAGVMLGLKGGIGVTTQDFNPDGFVDTSVGVVPTFGANIAYAIGDKVVVGLLGEYQMLSLDMEVFGYEVDWGDANSITLMPFVEWHFIGRSAAGISPYLLIAAGGNLNSFDVDDQVKQEARLLYGGDYDIEVDDTFGFKVGFGSDFFITEKFAANLELGWKYNKGEARETLNGVSIGSGDFNASNFAFTGGLRYYF